MAKVGEIASDICMRGMVRRQVGQLGTPARDDRGSAGEAFQEASEAASEGIDKDDIRRDIETLKGTMRGMNEWELASMRARVRAKGSSTAAKLMDALQKPLPKPGWAWWVPPAR